MVATKKAASPKKAVKKAPKKEKSDIKRPKSAYMFFFMEERPNIVKKNPSMGVADVAKEVGAAWKKKSEKEKAPYEKKAAEDKARYETEKAKKK